MLNSVLAQNTDFPMISVPPHRTLEPPLWAYILMSVVANLPQVLLGLYLVLLFILNMAVRERKIKIWIIIIVALIFVALIFTTKILFGISDFPVEGGILWTWPVNYD